MTRVSATVLTLFAVAAFCATAASAQTIQGYAGTDNTCSNAVVSGSLANNACVSASVQGLQISAQGTCNSDNTLTGTLFASLTCQGSGSSTASYTNVPMGQCNGPIQVTEGGTSYQFYVKIFGCGGVSGASSATVAAGAALLGAAALIALA